MTRSTQDPDVGRRAEWFGCTFILSNVPQRTGTAIGCLRGARAGRLRVERNVTVGSQKATEVLGVPQIWRACRGDAGCRASCTVVLAEVSVVTAGVGMS